MTDHIEKAALEAAADLLENTLHRKNYTVDTLEAVAARFIEFRQMVAQQNKRGFQAQVEAKIAKVLEKGPNMAVNIKVATGVSMTSIRPALRSMVGKGVIEVIGKADRCKVYKLVKK